MSKLMEQNYQRKSRFLKYSLLASISVGAIIAAPFEGMASSEVSKEYDTVKRDESSSGLLKPVQRAQSMNSQKRKIERERRKTVSFANVSNVINNENSDVPEIIVTDFNLSSVTPPEVQNNTPFFTPPISSEQATTTSEQKEGQSIVTISYKPVVSSSTEDQFITAPSTPNTTPLLSASPTSPHIQTPPTTPGTPYEKTPESKPNVGVNNTPPKPGIAVDLPLKWAQQEQQEKQSTTQIKPLVPPKPLLPTKKSYTETAAEIVTSISQFNIDTTGKIAGITTIIEGKSGKDRESARKIKVEITSKRKEIQKIESQAKEKADKINKLDQTNSTLYDNNRGVISDNEREKNKLQIEENIGKIKKLEKELGSKKNEAEKLFQKIDTSANTVVSINTQVVAKETPTAVPFLNQQQILNANNPLKQSAQQQKVNAARQADADKKKMKANEVKRNSAENVDFINQRDQEQLGQNITTEKTKKQLKKERHKQQKAERKRLEEKKANDKKEDISNIQSDIKIKMQQIPDANTISNKLQELELKVNTIEDKKKKQEAKKQLSELKKQAADKAQKVAAKEANITNLQKLQTKIEGYLATATVTNSNIEANIKNLENIFPTSPTPPYTSAISHKQSQNNVPLTSWVKGVQEKQKDRRIYDEDGYLRPDTVEVVSPQPEGFDSGFGSGTLGKEIDADAGFYQGRENVQHTQAEDSLSSYYIKNLQRIGAKSEEDLTKYDKTVTELNSEWLTGSVQQEGNKSFHKAAEEAGRIANTETRELALSKLITLQQRAADNHQTNLSIDSKLIEKAAQLLSNLEQKENEMRQITSPLQQKSLDLNLKEVGKYKQGVIKITQKLQQVLIHKPKNAEERSAKAEKKLDDIKNKTDLFFNKIETDAAVSKSTAQAVSLDLKTLEFLGYQDNITQTLDTVARANNTERPILFQKLLKALKARKQEAREIEEHALIHKMDNPDDNEAKEQAKLATKSIKVLLKKYDADIKLVEKASEDNKENNRKNNNAQKLSSPGLGHLGLEEKFAPLRKYDALEDGLQKVTASKKAAEKQYDTLRARNPSDPKLEELAIEHIELQKKQSQLEQDIKAIDPLFQDSRYSDTGGSEPSRPYSVGDISSVLSYTESNISRSSSVNSLSSDLLWDNTGDIGVGHRYEIAAFQKLQIAVIDESQKLESQLESQPGTSSGADQIVQQINKLKEKEEDIRNVLSGAEKDPLKFDQIFPMEEINEELKKYDVVFPKASMSDSVESISNLVGSKENLDEEFDELVKGEGLDTESVSGISGTEAEEQENEEVTESAIQETGKQLLPAPSNWSALSEKEWLALGDGSEDESDSNDSGIDSESEEEAVDQLSDSEDDNLKTTEIDTAILLKQEEKEEVKKDIAATAPTLNQGSQIVKSVGNFITSTRLDTAVAAGDEEETRIKRGLWVRGMYGINNHGRVENINGYRGTNKGATIGFDVEIDNNIVGIAYSNVHSVFKFKNSKNNDKEIIDSHVVSIYGQKELPKDFALQALISASKNFIKDKTTYSYGDNKIKSNVKHRNHSYNAEALLNYNYLVKSNLVITPNIGLRYGKSRDGVYNETGINVQEIALTMKENNILSGIVGTKVKVPLKDALKFNNLGLTFQGAVEHNFKEKTQRINRVVKIFDTEFKQDYAIPKQPKTSYNLGTGITGSIKNTTISLDYNYYLNKHYRSHQGSVKLKVNL